MATAGYDFKVPHVDAAVDRCEDKFGLIGQTYNGHGGDKDGGKEYSADFWTTSKSKHDEVFNWTIANAVSLGVKYVISWNRIWSQERASEGVRNYERDANDDGIIDDSEAHENHVHVTYNQYPPPAWTTPPPDQGILGLTELERYHRG